MTTDETILVVGAGHAGFQLAVSLRQAGFQGPIKLVNDEAGEKLPQLPWPAVNASSRPSSRSS